MTPISQQAQILEMPTISTEKPEVLDTLRSFEEYIAADAMTVAKEHQKLSELASQLEYVDVCQMRDWFFDNRGQFFGTSKLRTFEAYAVFRNIADIRRAEALFTPSQNA